MHTGINSVSVNQITLNTMTATIIKHMMNQIRLKN